MDLNRIGFIIDGSDQFVRPIEAVMRTHYQGDRFSPRFIHAPVIGTTANKLLFEVQLTRFLANHDLVFFEWSGSTLIRVSHMRKRCKIIARLHSIELATAAHLIDWSQVDVAIVPSRHIQQRLLSAANTAPPTIRVVPYGVDLECYRPAPRHFSYRLGMLCRVVPIKRVYEAILTLAELRRQGHPFSLEVVGTMGDGEEARYAWAVTSLVEQLELQDAVTFHGFVRNIADWFKSIDIFLSNSYWEGQQVSLLEAMASGCYCLSHSWRGSDEVLPPEQIYTTDSDLQLKLLAFAALPEDDKVRAQRNMRLCAETLFDHHRMVNDTLDIVLRTLAM